MRTMYKHRQKKSTHQQQHPFKSRRNRDHNHFSKIQSQKPTHKETQKTQHRIHSTLPMKRQKQHNNNIQKKVNHKPHPHKNIQNTISIQIHKQSITNPRLWNKMNTKHDHRQNMRKLIFLMMAMFMSTRHPFFQKRFPPKNHKKQKQKQSNNQFLIQQRSQNKMIFQRIMGLYLKKTPKPLPRQMNNQKHKNRKHYNFQPITNEQQSIYSHETSIQNTFQSS